MDTTKKAGGHKQPSSFLPKKNCYEKRLCLVNLCSQMDCFSMHASVDKEDMSLSFTVVSKREENIAFSSSSSFASRAELITHWDR